MNLGQNQEYFQICCPKTWLPIPYNIIAMIDLKRWQSWRRLSVLWQHHTAVIADWFCLKHAQTTNWFFCSRKWTLKRTKELYVFTECSWLLSFIILLNVNVFFFKIWHHRYEISTGPLLSGLWSWCSWSDATLFGHWFCKLGQRLYIPPRWPASASIFCILPFIF